MGDQPKPPDPELPEAWKKTPDPRWKPSPPRREGPSPKRMVFTAIAWALAIIVGIPILWVLLFLGSCLLEVAKH